MLIRPNKPLSGALNHIWNWQEFRLKRASIRYIVRYTKIISKLDCGNAKKLLPRVGTPHCNTIFEIDDSAIPKKDFTYPAMCPAGSITGNTVALSTIDPLCIKGYSCGQEYRFAVGFGQCFGQNWVHVVCEEPDGLLRSLWSSYNPMLDRVPEHAQSMKKTHLGAACSQVYILQLHLPPSTWILQISCVMWKGSGICGVKLEVVRDPSFGNVSGEWTGFDVDVSRLFFVSARYHLIGLDIVNREQTIPTVTGGVSQCLFSSLTMS